MIDKYVEDIKKSLENKCYFSALALALSLPDICGMAEFPDEPSVGKRYMQWYDKYLGEYMAQNKKWQGAEMPWLSGEIIYNLRNTYLHSGSPNIMENKIQDKTNQINKFTLILGDSTRMWDLTFFHKLGEGIIKYKHMIVDVTYLCNTICDCSLQYYKTNIEKFHFDFNAVSQEELLENNEVLLKNIINSFNNFLCSEKTQNDLSKYFSAEKN